jgi:hypothetical protein
METLITFGFGLGASSVLIILGGVFVFRLIKRINNLEYMSKHYQDRLRNDSIKLDDIVGKIYANMDSRLDKLESKIKNEQGSKQIIK